MDHLIWFFFQDDFADNREFIALLVYDTGGKKVFYPCMWDNTNLLIYNSWEIDTPLWEITLVQGK